jgi:hypothetical protein
VHGRSRHKQYFAHQRRTYDPALTWQPTGPLQYGRVEPTATLLLDGSVLVAGGRGDHEFIPVTERYDPVRGTWRTNGASTTCATSTPPRSFRMAKY